MKLGRLICRGATERQILDGLEDELVDDEKTTWTEGPTEQAAVGKTIEKWDALEWVYLVYLNKEDTNQSYMEIYKPSYLCFEPSDLKFVSLVYGCHSEDILKNAGDLEREMESVHQQSIMVLDMLSRYHQALKEHNIWVRKQEKD